MNMPPTPRGPASPVPGTLQVAALLLLSASALSARSQTSADFDGTPLQGIAPLSVQFQDLSSGGPTSWSWSFGDGSSSTLQNPTHVYTSHGTFTVLLTTNGPGGPDSATKPGFVIVTPAAPVADFTADRVEGRAPLTVQFQEATSGVITSGSWDLGDGTTSNALAPVHTYVTPGTYDVTLTVSGPGGTTAETKSAFVHVKPIPAADLPGPTGSELPPEEADFFAYPRSGPAPLLVHFTNLSRGPWRRKSWTFGDGNNATLAHPVHVYSAPGLYTVTLLVRKDFGASSDVEVKSGYIEVTAPLVVLDDGGFESSAQAPWGLTDQAPHRILSATGDGPDGAMPTQGDRWLELSTAGTQGALPPEVIGGAGDPPVGASGVAYDLVFDPLHPKVAFDLAFLLGGPRSSTDDNDFLSVDLGRGTKSVNVFYRDSWSSFPEVSTRHGLPMTALETVRVDLLELFPNASAGDRIRLQARVGNGGADGSDSYAYLDALRRIPTGTAVLRRGRGSNAACYSAGPPRLGQPWTAKVKTDPLNPPRFVALVGSDRLSPSNLGSGQLFVSLVEDVRFLLVVPTAGASTNFTLDLPPDAALAGHVIYSQALRIGDHGIVPCNGLDLLLGY